jgi:2-polyprenyl-6-methoxyphenol hydroxylase-like FAD-dependent oxidoreductase
MRGAHGGVATEWFDRGQTIAMLPLWDRQTLLVRADARTRSKCRGTRWRSTRRATSHARSERRTQRRWGDITADERSVFCYPLVAVYADRFIAGRRFALLGDAAVGMHPVTAHGFNFGLRGAFVLERVRSCARAPGES